MCKILKLIRLNAYLVVMVLIALLSVQYSGNTYEYQQSWVSNEEHNPQIFHIDEDGSVYSTSDIYYFAGIRGGADYKFGVDLKKIDQFGNLIWQRQFENSSGFFDPHSEYIDSVVAYSDDKTIIITNVRSGEYKLYDDDFDDLWCEDQKCLVYLVLDDEGDLLEANLFDFNVSNMNHFVDEDKNLHWVGIQTETIDFDFGNDTYLSEFESSIFYAKYDSGMNLEHVFEVEYNDEESQPRVSGNSENIYFDPGISVREVLFENQVIQSPDMPNTYAYNSIMKINQVYQGVAFSNNYDVNFNEVYSVSNNQGEYISLLSENLIDQYDASNSIYCGDEHALNFLKYDYETNQTSCRNIIEGDAYSISAYSLTAFGNIIAAVRVFEGATIIDYPEYEIQFDEEGVGHLLLEINNHGVVQNINRIMPVDNFGVYKYHLDCRENYYTSGPIYENTMISPEITGNHIYSCINVGNGGGPDIYVPDYSNCYVTRGSVEKFYFGIENNVIYHSADSDSDAKISMSELLRLIQIFSFSDYQCDSSSEDGYALGEGGIDCLPHSGDYIPQDWKIDLSELLRLIQLYSQAGYYYCPDEGTEDGYCLGSISCSAAK